MVTRNQVTHPEVSGLARLVVGDLWARGTTSRWLAMPSGYHPASLPEGEDWLDYLALTEAEELEADGGRVWFEVYKDRYIQESGSGRWVELVGEVL